MFNIYPLYGIKGQICQVDYNISINRSGGWVDATINDSLDHDIVYSPLFENVVFKTD